MLLVPIKRINRVVQTPLRVLIRMGRERVVDPWRPVFFLECGKDHFLVRRRHLELLDKESSKAEF
jgi:hypothetical protein